MDDFRDRAIAEKRMIGLVKHWKRLLDENLVGDWQHMAFNASIASKVVRYYVRDLNILKQRYKIPQRAQMPKIAGLMANAIL
jgi:hypothetical protein